VRRVTTRQSRDPPDGSDPGGGLPDPLNLMDLTGRVALVTGGSRGLGRAAVMALAAAGAEVIVVSRDGDACEALAAEVSTATGRRAAGYACHVGHWAQLDGLVERVFREFPQVDILINNAGVSPLYEDLAGVSESLWHKVMDVNLMGPFRLTAAIGTRMAEGRGGSIINISSIASEQPLPGVVPYAAAKAGLNAMTIGCARAFGPRVRVNAILPGAFLTDVSKHWDREQLAREVRSFALRRAAQPEELIGTILYLASDASSYTTGALIRVDGGYVPTIDAD
jgi:NAD(P)-dependent dehydrogenase (short-subunit alcohol dehydrogenase family)